MTETQWNEFLEKLEFCLLTGRWDRLPLHWLESGAPEGLGELEIELAEGLAELQKLKDGEEKQQQVQALCEEYRTRQAANVVSLDAMLCPPGCRVTLRYLDPKDLREGDCLVTVGRWDRVGHLIAEKTGLGPSSSDAPAPRAPKDSEGAIRREAGALNYNHLLIFPEKGTPSPRAFRSLCEKTLRQARGLGARRISVTHLHLPQPGLPDRFAAAELVSAIREMMRGATDLSVEILIFAQRRYDDYLHWFTSLKELSRASNTRLLEEADTVEESPSQSGAEGLSPFSGAASSLLDFARRSTGLATEATQQVGRWLGTQAEKAPILVAVEPWSFELQQRAAQLYLGSAQTSQELEEREEPSAHAIYLDLVAEFLTRGGQQDFDPETYGDKLRAELGRISTEHPLARYYRFYLFLLERESQVPEDELRSSLGALRMEASIWEDAPLLDYLDALEELAEVEANPSSRIPVIPAGAHQNWPRRQGEEANHV